MLKTELERFIEEDIGDDETPFIPDIEVRARIIVKQDGILAGLEEAFEVFEYFGLKFSSGFNDGDRIHAGDTVCEIWGPAPDVLRAERLSLNFLCKMSGIATLTASCVSQVPGIRVAATRKTTPGFRKFEKKAVRLGGGDTHRFNLSDAVMVKDNHAAIMGMEQAVVSARKAASFSKKIEAEVTGIEEMLIAAGAGADIIMFDNMQPEEIRLCVKALEDANMRSCKILEASGGITPDNISKYADSGVDVISMGALIHSARWLDMSTEII